MTRLPTFGRPFGGREDVLFALPAACAEEGLLGMNFPIDKAAGAQVSRVHSTSPSMTIKTESFQLGKEFTHG